jgi:hypothetical protein
MERLYGEGHLDVDATVRQFGFVPDQRDMGW